MHRQAGKTDSATGPGLPAWREAVVAWFRMLLSPLHSRRTVGQKTGAATCSAETRPAQCDKRKGF